MLTRLGGPNISRGRRKTSQQKPFKAPTKGLVLNENLASARPLGALVLENFTPTSRGIRMRRGSALFATVGDAAPVESLMTYDAGTTKKLFAVSDDEIFDITSVADEEVSPTAIVTGLNSSYFSYVNITTTGGSFLVAVNGSDPMQLYDGTDFWPITGTAIIALDYDAESAAFTVGETLTGGTSGATGTIIKVTDNGSDGTIYMNNVSGTFQNDETITDSDTGSATADGAPSTLYGAITGVDTSTWSHVWTYRNRLYFIKANSLTVNYLGVDAISGAAGTLSLNGVIQRGGNLLSGGTWSLDAGDGVDDKMVILGDRGERVVYEGNNPGDSNTWSLVGRYDGSPPLGKRASMSAGGDLLVADETGLIAVSASITKDSAAIGVTSVTRSIEPLWTPTATARKSLPWECVKWPERQVAIISTPVTSGVDDPQCFIINLETGATAVYTGWDTRCLALHDGIVYFGTNTGTVMEAETGGSDAGSPYVCRVAWNWDHCGGEGFWKEYTSVRAIFRAGRPFNPKVSISTDYVTSWPAAPDAADSVASSLWDEGLWDEAVWDGSNPIPVVTTPWYALQAAGSVASPQIQITSGSTSYPDCELVSVHLVWNEGDFLT